MVSLECGRQQRSFGNHTFHTDHATECEMTTLKAWMRERLNTPEKARTPPSNIAVAGGMIGLVLTIIGVIVAHS